MKYAEQQLRSKKSRQIEWLNYLSLDQGVHKYKSYKVGQTVKQLQQDYKLGD